MTELVDFDRLPAAALLTTAQVSTLIGFSVSTLQKWRGHSAGSDRCGPAYVYVEGRPRYKAGDVRAYLNKF